MAEPARKPLAPEGLRPGERTQEKETSPFPALQRWVERPDGHLELVELPLTPELFLDPQLEDSIIQSRPHSRGRRYFAELLERRFLAQEDVMVLEEVKHLLGPGLPGPAPDVSVIRGARHPDPELRSYDVVEQGVVPCLVIEIVSPDDAEIRRIDEVGKVALYAQVGIPEYLLVYTPRRATGNRYRLRGYRLGPEGRYLLMEPDAQGRLLSETTGLWFAVSPAGDRIDVIDVATGERLRTPQEEEEGRKAAAAELARLRAKLERLEKSGG
jgi:Uma2 family endonuclease